MYRESGFDDWTSGVISLSLFVPTWLAAHFAGLLDWQLSLLVALAAFAGWSLNPAIKRIIANRKLAFATALLGCWLLLSVVQHWRLNEAPDREFGKWVYVLLSGAAFYSVSRLVIATRSKTEPSQNAFPS